ncbi:MAG: cupin domain-containing protein [Planctomycetes bacterium]|nr:cupin domain-containing protein [Planctomycetota bacterium]
MKRISLDEQIVKTTRAWIPNPIAHVDDHIVYIAYYKDGDPPIYGSGNKFHRHDGDQLLIVLSGKVTIFDRVGGQIAAHKGDAVHIASGDHHRASSPEGAHVLHIQSNRAAAMFKEEFDRGPEVVAG